MHHRDHRLALAAALAVGVCAVGAAAATGGHSALAHAEGRSTIAALVTGAPAATEDTEPPGDADPAPPDDQPPAPSPPEPGPAPQPLPIDDSGAPELRVGVTHVTFVDPDRGRTVGVTVHYPTAGPATTPADEPDSVPAAPGRFPLVVFAHGYAASAGSYARLERAVAAAGFVVAAPDFPHSSIASADGLDRGDLVNQAGDVSLVISGMFDPASSPDAVRGSIAPVPVGVMGHSDGGITAAAVAYNDGAADPRVGAAVTLSGAQVAYGGPWFTAQSPPLLAVHGDADGVNPYWSSSQLFDDAAGPRWLVTVLGGGHGPPFMNAPVVDQVAALAADFLHAYLEHDGAAQARIPGDANADGLALAAAA